MPGLKELLTAFDFETVAYAKQPRTAYDYPAHGADSEFTLRRNRQAYDWVELVSKRIAARRRASDRHRIIRREDGISHHRVAHRPATAF